MAEAVSSHVSLKPGADDWSAEEAAALVARILANTDPVVMHVLGRNGPLREALLRGSAEQAQRIAVYVLGWPMSTLSAFSDDAAAAGEDPDGKTAWVTLAPAALDKLNHAAPGIAAVLAKLQAKHTPGTVPPSGMDLMRLAKAWNVSVLGVVRASPTSADIIDVVLPNDGTSVPFDAFVGGTFVLLSDPDPVSGTVVQQWIPFGVIKANRQPCSNWVVFEELMELFVLPSSQKPDHDNQRWAPVRLWVRNADNSGAGFQAALRSFRPVSTAAVFDPHALDWTDLVAQQVPEWPPAVPAAAAFSFYVSPQTAVVSFNPAAWVSVYGGKDPTFSLTLQCTDTVSESEVQAYVAGLRSWSDVAVAAGALPETLASGAEISIEQLPGAGAPTCFSCGDGVDPTAPQFGCCTEDLTNLRRLIWHYLTTAVNGWIASGQAAIVRVSNPYDRQQSLSLEAVRTLLGSDRVNKLLAEAPPLRRAAATVATTASASAAAAASAASAASASAAAVPAQTKQLCPVCAAAKHNCVLMPARPEDFEIDIDNELASVFVKFYCGLGHFFTDFPAQNTEVVPGRYESVVLPTAEDEIALTSVVRRLCQQRIEMSQDEEQVVKLPALQCPRCSQFVTKDPACLKVTCRCGNVFCFGCGLTMDQCGMYLPFSAYNRPCAGAATMTYENYVHATLPPTLESYSEISGGVKNTAAELATAVVAVLTGLHVAVDPVASGGLDTLQTLFVNTRKRALDRGHVTYHLPRLMTTALDGVRRLQRFNTYVGCSASVLYDPVAIVQTLELVRILRLPFDGDVDFPERLREFVETHPELMAMFPVLQRLPQLADGTEQQGTFNEAVWSIVAPVEFAVRACQRRVYVTGTASLFSDMTPLPSLYVMGPHAYTLWASPAPGAPLEPKHGGQWRWDRIAVAGFEFGDAARTFVVSRFGGKMHPLLLRAVLAATRAAVSCGTGVWMGLVFPDVFSTVDDVMLNIVSVIDACTYAAALTATASPTPSPLPQPPAEMFVDEWTDKLFRSVFGVPAASVAWGMGAAAGDADADDADDADGDSLRPGKRIRTAEGGQRRRQRRRRRRQSLDLRDLFVAM